MPVFAKRLNYIKVTVWMALLAFLRIMSIRRKILYDTAAKLKLNPNEFHIMLSATPTIKPYSTVDDGTLGLIINNPYSFRLNGESVMASYVTDFKMPEEVAEYVKKLEKRAGGKKIMLISQVTGRYIWKWMKNYEHPLDTYVKKKSVPAIVLLHYLDYISRYLRVSGGVEIADIYNTSFIESRYWLL